MNKILILMMILNVSVATAAEIKKSDNLQIKKIDTTEFKIPEKYKNMRDPFSKPEDKINADVKNKNL